MDNILKIDNGFGEERVFRITKQPDGVVWNIGRENFPFPKMVPMCHVKSDYSVKMETLNAFECKDEETALRIMKEAQRRTVTGTEVVKINKARNIASTFFCIL